MTMTLQVICSFLFNNELNNILAFEWKNDLKLVAIYFDTPGYDEITKDTAAKFVDRLSAIGGTFGLLTGFSLISGVEILYFMTKFLMSYAEEKNK